MLRLFVLAMLAFCGPALALTVTDGSASGLPQDEAAKIIDILSIRPDMKAEAEVSGLRAAGGDPHIYCGMLSEYGVSVPMMIDTYAGVSYVLWDTLEGDQRNDVQARVGAYGCIPQ